MSGDPLGAALQEKLRLFEGSLTAYVSALRWPDRLAEAARYSLSSGGKRVRPCLALLAAEAVGGNPQDALPWAIAVELIHTYSLIHDDLPSMDDDDERRGLPTCHRRFDEATAILAGDALLTEAFLLLSNASSLGDRRLPLLQRLGKAAGGAGMVGGQVEDIEGARGLTSLREMQAKKTGALIHAALVGGAESVGASQDQLEALSVHGDALGLLFQITDDLIDEAQDAERGGNSFLHHLSTAEVFQWRDRCAEEAIQALAPLGREGALLQAFSRKIQSRER